MCYLGDNAVVNPNEMYLMTFNVNIVKQIKQCNCEPIKVNILKGLIPMWEHLVSWTKSMQLKSVD